MKQAMSGILKFILGWIFLTILIVFFVQARELYNSNPIVRPRQGVIEAFTEERVQDSESPSLQGIKPGDPGLLKPNEPYNLLNGWLDPADKPLYPSSKRCYEADFQTRLERTGNFRQLTNNYKRGDPDSCSNLTHDLSLAFYNPQPVEQVGCIQPYA
jgi:hypothetical protein